MRVRQIWPHALVLALGLVSTATGCQQGGCSTPNSAGFNDVGANASGGAATPEDGLSQFLTSHPAHFPQQGWHRVSSTGDLVAFASGGSKVIFSRLSDGTWYRSEERFCA